MQQPSLTDHELMPTAVWGSTKFRLYEEEHEEQPTLRFVPGPRWRVKEEPAKEAKLPTPATEFVFAKEAVRTLKGQYMDVTLGRILCNLHVNSGQNDDKLVVTLIELRYESLRDFVQPIPTAMITDSSGGRTNGRSFNEISEVILEDQQMPVWFPAPARILQPREQTTGWVVFDHLARGCKEISLKARHMVPRYLRLALAVYETPGSTTGRLRGEEIFEFNIN